MTTGELLSLVELAAPGMNVAPADSFGSRKMSRCGSGSDWISARPKLSASRPSVAVDTRSSLAVTLTVSCSVTTDSVTVTSTVWPTASRSPVCSNGPEPGGLGGEVVRPGRQAGQQEHARRIGLGRADLPGGIVADAHGGGRQHLPEAVEHAALERGLGELRAGGRRRVND